ncbi:hypothetical protein SETIT_3G408500v2 [Setaria italica]|uniref:Uncharacterized protein n=1 Tax=Setaria italica TaxID=4555 RepID=A0A368QP24_SETIT|nr:hypothetical protein SETIT_3G408500v2 [Setaria italica]
MEEDVAVSSFADCFLYFHSSPDQQQQAITNRKLLGLDGGGADAAVQRPAAGVHGQALLRLVPHQAHRRPLLHRRPPLRHGPLRQIPRLIHLLSPLSSTHLCFCRFFFPVSSCFLETSYPGDQRTQSMQAELGKPSLVHPNKGKVSISFDCSPTAVPSFQVGEQYLVDATSEEEEDGLCSFSTCQLTSMARCVG